METLAEQKLDVVTSAKMLETFQLNALGPLRVQQAVDKMMASPGKVCVVSTRGRAEVSSRPLPSPRNIHVAAAASPRPASAISTERRIDLAGTGMGSIGDNGSGGFYAYRASKAAVNMIARGGVSFSKGSRRRTVGGRVAATPRARTCPWVAVSPRGRSTRHPRRRRDPSRMIHVHSRRRRVSPRTIHAAPAAAPRLDEKSSQAKGLSCDLKGRGIAVVAANPNMVVTEFGPGSKMLKGWGAMSVELSARGRAACLSIDGRRGLPRIRPNATASPRPSDTSRADRGTPEDTSRVAADSRSHGDSTPRNIHVAPRGGAATRARRQHRHAGDS